jgi:hypothetical protein
VAVANVPGAHTSDEAFGISGAPTCTCAQEETQQLVTAWKRLRFCESQGCRELQELINGRVIVSACSWGERVVDQQLQLPLRIHKDRAIGFQRISINFPWDRGHAASFIIGSRRKIGGGFLLLLACCGCRLFLRGTLELAHFSNYSLVLLTPLFHVLPRPCTVIFASDTYFCCGLLVFIVTWLGA